MVNARKGFLAIEYAVLLAIIVAALIGMSVYLKRSLCGKWRAVGDTFGFGRQYGEATPPPGLLPDVPTDGSSAQEAFHTCFHGQMEKTPMPPVGEVNGIARICTNDVCRPTCPSYPPSQGQECWSGCSNYCAALCSTLPSEYKESCESGCE